MKPKLDDVVSTAVVGAVTAIFLAETITLWPDPIRLNRFTLVIENPLANLAIKSGDSTRLASSSISMR